VDSFRPPFYGALVPAKGITEAAGDIARPIGDSMKNRDNATWRDTPGSAMRGTSTWHKGGFAASRRAPARRSCSSTGCL
jgi:hypothetical protein